ncbi:hypothetical protein ACIQNG_38165 [Streptomyces sp. NPDC091377]|uniref:hypothetical protein n=1 Tax=unclassified Streptomyces TaxID=2593676 RepID=UPI0037F24DBD
MGRVNSGRIGPFRRFPQTGPRHAEDLSTQHRTIDLVPKGPPGLDGPRLQELTMADVAFVVTTIALFALVALAAKGVTKL